MLRLQFVKQIHRFNPLDFSLLIVKNDCCLVIFNAVMFQVFNLIPLLTAIVRDLTSKFQLLNSHDFAQTQQISANSLQAVQVYSVNKGYDWAAAQTQSGPNSYNFVNIPSTSPISLTKAKIKTKRCFFFLFSSSPTSTSKLLRSCLIFSMIFAQR